MTSRDVAPSWDGLILPDATLTQLKLVCEWLRNTATLRAHAFEIPRVLLYGPPGTGKTQIARTLTAESGRAFVAVSPTQLRAGHIGQSGHHVRQVFERARSLAPSVLFFDDLEWSASARDSGRSDHITGEIVTELLAQMDSLRRSASDVFVLAATENPAHVDPAVRLRHALHLEIPKPTPDERRRMLKTFLGHYPVDFNIDDTAAELATLSNGMSGRDLKSLVTQASKQAAERAIQAGTLDRIGITRADLLGPLAVGGR